MVRIQTGPFSSRTLIVLLLLAFPRLGFTNAEFIPIQERAQGQSLSGAQQLNDSLYSNPAGGAFTQVYSVEGTYQLPKSFGISILDTKTSEVGGGVGYFRTAAVNSDEWVQGLKLGLIGRASSSIGVGVAGKTVWGPNLSGNADRFYDVDSGILANLTPLQLGLAFRNWLGGNAGFDQYREFALGARLNYQDTFFLSTTVLMKWGVWNPSQYGVGAEYISPYYFSLKGGYRYLPDGGNSFWSIGASILSPNLSLHYAVEIPNQPDQGLEHVLAAALLL